MPAGLIEFFAKYVALTAFGLTQKYKKDAKKQRLWPGRLEIS